MKSLFEVWGESRFKFEFAFDLKILIQNRHLLGIIANMDTLLFDIADYQSHPGHCRQLAYDMAN